MGKTLINDTNLSIVGKYKKIYNDLLDIDLPCDYIYQSEGLKIHVNKRHPKFMKYIKNISEIINNPDYIGTNPKEKNSIEFIKCYDNNILVAVKLDVNKNYLYVASLYDIHMSKIKNRLYSGRLKKFDEIVDTTPETMYNMKCNKHIINNDN